MAPGFTSVGFVGGRRSILHRTHPDREADIDRLGVRDDDGVDMPADLAT
jgi:hypothetical protein